MDLWNVKNVKEKARRIVEARGFKVKEVYSLTTGLWIDVKLDNGDIVKVLDYEIS